MIPLSEAILLGSSLAPLGQAGGGDASCGLEHRTETRCAIEVALMAVGRGELHWNHASDVWPWLGDYNVERSSPMFKIVNEFDGRRIREDRDIESFISFVRSIEPPEQPEPATRMQRGYDARTQTWKTVAVPA